MTPRLTARALGVVQGTRTLVDALNFTLAPGDSLAILGKNGAGKTSLLQVLAGLATPARGAVALAGEAYAALGARRAARLRAYLPQQPFDAVGASVLEVALMGRHPHLSRWAGETAADVACARDALEAVGLQGFEARRADTLSGGERQRLSIATLLAQAAPLALLDEPLAHLDLGVQSALLGVLAARIETRVMVLHEPNLALKYCQRALLLFDGGHWLLGPAEEVITTDTLERLHGHPFYELRDGEHRALLPA